MAACLPRGAALGTQPSPSGSSSRLQPWRPSQRVATPTPKLAALSRSQATGTGFPLQERLVVQQPCNGSASRDAPAASSSSSPATAARNSQAAAASSNGAAAAASRATAGSSAAGSSAGEASCSGRPEQPLAAGLRPGAVAAVAGAAVVAEASALSPPLVVEGVLAGYPPVAGSSQIRDSWNSLMRWSRYFRSKEESDAVERIDKIVVFGGGSFGTAMGVCLARQKRVGQVTMLLRDPALCRDINEMHCNTRYLKDFSLPPNVNATTNAAEAIAGAQFAIHAVPVQHTRAFLQGIKDLLPPTVPIVSVSKGIEVSSGQLMSEVIPSVLGKKQPTVYLSGPSFAKEVMIGRPTGIVAASKDKALARNVQRLFASPDMRVNTTTDVIGVEICGSLKNVLAIAAGIVEGLELGPNAMAALVAQGCAEIRWLATKMGAKTATISGLSGLGDIMLTCYGSLSRNRTVGVRLGQGEKLSDILASSTQVAEGVATAAVVVNLARKYRVQLPVLTAVAQVVDGHITAKQAVFEIMNLPQIEER